MDISSKSWRGVVSLTKHRFLTAPCFIALALFAFLFLASWLPLHGLRTKWDMGYFTQAAWLLSEGREPFISINNLHLFGDHVYLLLFPVAWLTKIFPTTLTLIGLQAAGLALAVFGLNAFCRRVANLDSKTTAFLLVAFAFFPALHNAAVPGFHPEKVTIAAFFFALVFAHERRWVYYGLAVGILLLTREDFALTVAAIGILVAFKYSKRAGLLTTCAAFGWLAVQLLVVLPHFSDGYRHVALLDAYGNTISEVVAFIATHPLDVVADLMTRTELVFVVAFLGPVMFLAMGRLAWLAPAIPLQVMFLLSSRPLASTISNHYAMQSIPFVFMATAMMLKSIKFRTRLSTALVGSSVVFWALFANTNPLRPNVYQPFQRRDAASYTALKALDFVPPDAVVATNYLGLLPPLAERPHLIYLPTALKGSSESRTSANRDRMSSVEWVIFDESQRRSFRSPQSVLSALETLGFESVFHENGVHVFRKAQRTQPIVTIRSIA